MIDQLLTDYASPLHGISGNVIDSVSDHERMLSNYQLYNNQLNQKDFERECNPLGINVGQFKDEIQPYNKSYNKVQVLLGDELKRHIPYTVVLASEDGIKSKQQEKNLQLATAIQAQIQAVTAQAQGQEAPPVMSPEELEELVNTPYLHAKEKLVRQLLEYLIRAQRIKEKMNDSFKHGLISGTEKV